MLRRGVNVQRAQVLALLIGQIPYTQTQPSDYLLDQATNGLLAPRK